MINAIEPFSLFLPDRLETPLVISIPHSGTFAPPEFLQSIQLSPKELKISEDCYTDELFSESLELNIPTIKANYSRNYIDVNREPFELNPDMFSDELPAYINHKSVRADKGFGTIPEIVEIGKKIYDRKLSFAEVKERIRDVYLPYHQTLGETIKSISKQFGRCFLIDAHSMPSAKGLKPVDFVLGDNYGTACSKELSDLISSFLQSAGYSVSLNIPYPGGYTTRHYGCPELGLEAIQIEINRSLYMDEKSFVKLPDFHKLAKDISSLLRSISSYAQNHG
ncbi:MAG: N-formylglutamate amidohydrolase [Alphaproteobacteria bacterium]|nr:N-formylglutamate amidohydrolase [Alphaproteobacteria bacterium]